MNVIIVIINVIIAIMNVIIVWRQETPKFGGEESQADVQDKLQHMRSMMTYLEASRLTRWLSTILLLINSYSSSSPNNLSSGTRRWTSWWMWRAGRELFILCPPISTTAKTNKGSHRFWFSIFETNMLNQFLEKCLSRLPLLSFLIPKPKFLTSLTSY